MRRILTAQIAFVDTPTGEFAERRLNHGDREAEKFYRHLKQHGSSVRVGMEATGYSRWFERLPAELGMELWMGDVAEDQNQASAQAEDGPSLFPANVKLSYPLFLRLFR
jgi:hypothetical protein